MLPARLAARATFCRFLCLFGQMGVVGARLTQVPYASFSGGERETNAVEEESNVARAIYACRLQQK